MITDDQLTALAREYAEETRNDILGFFPRPLPDSMEVLVKTDQKIYEGFLYFLLRRYCLVEKEAVRKWTGVKLRLPELRERVLICERVGNQYKIFIGKRVPSPCPDGWEWNQSTKESVVAWMPLPQYQSEIAKEVEE